MKKYLHISMLLFVTYPLPTFNMKKETILIHIDAPKFRITPFTEKKVEQQNQKYKKRISTISTNLKNKHKTKSCCPPITSPITMCLLSAFSTCCTLFSPCINLCSSSCSLLYYYLKSIEDKPSCKYLCGCLCQFLALQFAPEEREV